MLKWPWPQSGAAARTVAELEGTISAAQAERAALRALLAEAGVLASDWRQGRATVEALAIRAQEAQSTAETVAAQLASLEGLKTQLKQTEGFVETALQATAPLRTELEDLQSALPSLAAGQERVKAAADRARAAAASAEQAVKAVGEQLEPIPVLHEMAKTAEQRVAELLTLTDQVMQKIDVLEKQKASINHLLLEVNRLRNLRLDVAEKLARFDVVLREARNSLNAIQQDRERLRRETHHHTEV